MSYRNRITVTDNIVQLILAAVFVGVSLWTVYVAFDVCNYFAELLKSRGSDAELLGAMMGLALRGHTIVAELAVTLLLWLGLAGGLLLQRLVEKANRLLSRASAIDQLLHESRNQLEEINASTLAQYELTKRQGVQI